MMKKLLMVVIALSGLMSLTVKADIDPDVLSGALSELEAIKTMPQDETHMAEINQKYERFTQRLREGGATTTEIAQVFKDMGVGYATIGTATDTASTATVTTVNGDTGATGPKGDKGDTGSAGKDEVNGKSGAAGTAGVNGANGKAGLNGLNGKDGADGKIVVDQKTKAIVSTHSKVLVNHESRISNLEDKVSDIKRSVKRLGASSQAVGNLHYNANKSGYAVAAGAYGGESAIAGGLQFSITNRTAATVQVSYDGEYSGGSVGIHGDF